MFKAIVLVLVSCSVDASNSAVNVNVKVHDDADIKKAADQELQSLTDMSNQGLWQEAWSKTLAKHDAGDALMNDALKKALYPEAQLHFQNLIEARHRFKQQMKMQQDQQEQPQDAQAKAQQEDDEALKNAKEGFLQRMTAGIKDSSDDDPSVLKELAAHTTTTTTENLQVVQEREKMSALKDTEMAKMTEGVAEAKDDTPSTTTTTMDPAVKAEKEHFEALKEQEMSKLTANLDEKSINAAEATATTTTTSTTTTMSLGAAGRKIMAEIQSGKYSLPTVQIPPILSPNGFAGIQNPQQPQQPEDDSAMSETMEDLDTYGF